MNQESTRPIRISKYLSLCGVTSRRGAAHMIAEGRVTLNDSTVDAPGVIVNPEKDVVKVDGSRVEPVREKVYVLLHKPRNVMTTLHDPFKRRTVRHLLKSLPTRVYPVGRLDYDTDGVLLLTNDGDLAYRLAHPRYQIHRIYEARVQGHFRPEDAAAIEKGIKLDDGAIGRAKVNILGFMNKYTRIRLLLTEGRKREVKQLCKKVGHPVAKLTRVEFAGLSIKGLRAGQWRFLTPRELERLQRLVGLRNSE
ncbi:MAG: rRNA pseudouridine synthase [Candidatus Zixiibacteriota bacterium]|nr:MAG: rRNA pseudouridine synthase [candidate division Zixibacteria bacterium]